MIISERVLKVLKERKMTQAEFAKLVGIAPSTICEWKKRKMNPSADKIMDICNVLQITPEQLLTGYGIDDENTFNKTEFKNDFTTQDVQIIKGYHGLNKNRQKQFLEYIEALKKIENLENI